MEIVCLGFTQLLQTILGELFDAVLSPVLRDVFNILVNLFGQLIQNILADFLLRVWIIFLKLVYFIEQIFNVFSGISPVQVKDVSDSISLMEYFFRQSAVGKAFWTITAISVALAFMTTLFGCIKSMSDMALEDKNPLSTVLRRALQASFTFLVIPVSCLFFLRMTTTMIAVINTTFNYENEQASISDTLFITTAEPAAKSGTKTEEYASGQKYKDADTVKDNFEVGKIDYVQAYVSSLLVALILLCSILQFIQRIFMVLVLYLVSPFFVSMVPLDGGARFREWKDMFVAHMLSAFGPILVMKLYLLLVPSLADGSLSFGSAQNISAWIRLFFIIGGAFAVYRSRLLLITVINPMAAGAMAETGLVGAFIGGKLSSGMGKLAGGGGKGKKGGSSKGGGGSASSSQYMTKSQAFTGK